VAIVGASQNLGSAKWMAGFHPAHPLNPALSAALAGHSAIAALVASEPPTGATPKTALHPGPIEIHRPHDPLEQSHSSMTPKAAKCVACSDVTPERFQVVTEVLDQFVK